MGLTSFNVLQTPGFCNRVPLGCSRSSKMDDFGTNRKRLCDFLLVGHCNYGPISHRFWDTASYWLKIAYFSYPSLVRRLRSLCSFLEFRGEVNRAKNSHGAILQWRPHDRTGVALTWYRTMTDRQTEGRTDRRTESVIANTISALSKNNSLTFPNQS